MKTFLLLFFSCSFLPAYTQNFDDYPYAPAGKRWINNLDALPHSVTFTDLSPSPPVYASQIRVILLRNPNSVGYGPAYACGFYCNGTCESFLFSLFLVQVNSGSSIVMPTAGFPQVVWSANRNNPVHENATLELTSLGDLLLKDADGTPVWSSGTAGQGVTGLQIEMTGNLVLLNGDQSNKTIWQSFDHPTNALLPGQFLPAERKLVASISASNFSEGPFYLSVNKANGMSLYASVSYGSPQIYWNPKPGTNISLANPYAVYVNDSLDVFLSSLKQADVSLPFNTSGYLMPYIGMDPGGFLGVHGWNAQLNKWIVIYDFLEDKDRCAIPSTCGSYGLCTTGTQCLCLGADLGNSSISTDTFNPINPRKPSEGCFPHTQLLCDPKDNSSRNQHLLQVNNVDYFIFGDYYTLANGTHASIDQCKLICLQDCYCKAAFFQYDSTSDVSGNASGTCYTVTDVYTLRTTSVDVQHYYSVALIKIQNETLNIAPAPPIQINPPGTSKISKMRTIVVISTTVSVVSAIIIAVVFFLYKRRKNEMGEDSFAYDKVPGLPARFKYEELRVATENFRDKLGAGGFGTVFLGVLANGEQVAVKRLESSGQGNKEFRAEVCTIGSIHHLNLVRLCGFCAEKGHRLLVYELMPNGSLDRWIFSKSKDHHAPLDWSTRFSIAVGTAQGLAYLHEGCRDRILHFDVKPQNILLDEHFIAKVSDFGLSRFMGRDESQVVTKMRGTPGYLAPEWLHHSNVTEKADVYSFGVVLLEVVSGQKCFEASCDPDEQSIYLPARAQSLAQEGRFLKLVDNRLGIDFDEQQAVRMINTALWCIQGNSAERPSMSLVVQMLEGVLEVTPPPLTSIGTHGSNHRATAYRESIPSAVHVSAPR